MAHIEKGFASFVSLNRSKVSKFWFVNIESGKGLRSKFRSFWVKLFFVVTENTIEMWMVLFYAGKWQRCWWNGSVFYLYILRSGEKSTSDTFQVYWRENCWLWVGVPSYFGESSCFSFRLLISNQAIQEVGGCFKKKETNNCSLAICGLFVVWIWVVPASVCDPDLPQCSLSA